MYVGCTLQFNVQLLTFFCKGGRDVVAYGYHVICVHMRSYVCLCMVSEHMVFLVYKAVFCVILVSPYVSSVTKDNSLAPAATTLQASRILVTKGFLQTI